ncbi:TRAP transporter substrate-binding protein [[Clostridium] symbiosum]|uniref:TRAP transporter substrate-binding protein n=1 Tax=Clostridium symbiosum TaxID=1512 RepID=UPI001D09098D|nr:TRAP transporter substrate-binding protein [[Clostridium] symbiosum]MCB6608213.1 TRAP transporter substrate-binding protein [[Clostridium] symbiosum]MCB6930833.1 TRAP transporter substrate-binding protein [[Clostridium] symbiosum]
MKKWKRNSLAIVLSCLSVAMTACGGAGETREENGQEQGTAPKQQEEQAKSSSGQDSQSSAADKAGSASGQDAELSAAVDSMKSVTLKFGTNQAAGSPALDGCNYWADLVAEKTDGKIKIEVYESNTLGSQADMLDGLKMGTIDISYNSPATMSAAVPSVAILDLPYIFQSREHAYKVLDGEIGREIFKKAEEQEGYYVLASFEGGFRQSINSVHTIADLAGYSKLKFRVPESKVYLGLYEKLGAIPTAMAMGELFTALQNGTVDGMESPIATIASNRYYEAAKYLTIDNHIYAANPILISKKTLDQFPDPVRQMLYDTCREACEWERVRSAEEEDKLIEEMKAAGVEVTELSDDALQEIIKSVKPMWDDFAGTVGADMIEKVAGAN